MALRADGRFCPGCGQPVATPAMSAAGDDGATVEMPAAPADPPPAGDAPPAFDGPAAATRPPVTPPPTAPAGRGRSRGPLIAAIAGVLIIAAAVAAFLVLGSSDSTDEGTAYKAKVATAF